jgi:glycerate kinase
LSEVKGGKLAAMGKNAHRIISLVISDVVNDPLEVIASGPTVSLKKPPMSPREILEKFQIFSSLPESVREVLQVEQSLEPIENSEVFLIGNNRIAVKGAMAAAESFGFVPVFLSTEVQGNVAEVSRAFFGLAAAAKNFNGRAELASKLSEISKVLSAQPSFVDDLTLAIERGKKICVISGGETTVTVTGNGLGGRNQELALRFTKLCHESSLNDVWLLSAGTDGFDGNNEAAGALGASKILSTNLQKENWAVTMQDFISRNDSFRFYKNYAGDHQITTGHTGTNVMDIHLLVIDK